MALSRPYPPSYHQNFARGPSESAYPQTWRGLIGAWVPALGPTGATLRDVSGFGNDGTLTNMAPSSDWVISPGDGPKDSGYALDFIGGDTDEWINVGSFPIFHGLLTWTILAWVLPDQNNSDNDIFAMKKSEREFRLDNTGVFKGTFNDDTTFIQAISNTNVVLEDVWQHLVWAVDAIGTKQGRLFYNGLEISLSLQETGNGTVSDISAGLLGIGARNDGVADITREFNGRIGAILFYNRVLADAEILQLYQIHLAPFRLRPRAIGLVSAVVGIGTDYVGPIWQQEDSGGLYR